MYSPRGTLNTPADFNFPFKPYEIQQDLMESLYAVLENKKVGIFESPTGTGKSLTLTCAALKWLLDHEQLVRDELVLRINELTEEIQRMEEESKQSCNWIEEQFATQQKKTNLSEFRKIHTLIDEYNKKITEIQERRAREKQRTKLRSFIEGRETSHLSTEDDFLLNEFDEDPNEVVESENMSEYRSPKIFFCSRTHSQLSQVVREIKRTKFASKIRCVTLASRQNLCIHSDVKKLPSSTLINERCLDMQKSNSKVTQKDVEGVAEKKSRVGVSAKCPFKAQNALEDLKDSSLVDILDIEDLVVAGEKLKSCPYYSSREAAKDAHIVLLPYQMILHRKTRIQTGIDLRKSILIIDEAHNLLDTITSIYSAEINLVQLQTAQSQILAYKLKYSTRFSAKNLLKINQIAFIIKRLIKILSSTDTTSNRTRMIKTHELMSEGEFFNINIFHLLDFCEQTRFAQKVHGFAQKIERSPQPDENKSPITGSKELLNKLKESQTKGKKKAETPPFKTVDITKPVQSRPPLSMSVIRPLLAFLESLTECAEDGRVLITNDSDPKHSVMKFVLLNPGGHFEEIIRECRSIIIAGGTMQPTGGLVDQLFPSCAERVQFHFYDHVVSNDSVLPFAVRKGPTGTPLLFNFSTREKSDLIHELGNTLVNICNVVPAGVVCFFGSYEYLNTVYTQLSVSGILAKIQNRKHVFREPRSGQSIEKILVEYAKAVKDPERAGAILFSVVGGRLSEGLNFADDLGRCVVVVGMPYPNRASPELQEKMKYLDATLGHSAGTEYYENLCMKAVNQCIGRSIRHINDFACVLLLDERYGNEQVQKKLPAWISRNLKVPANFGIVQGTIANFFRNKRAR